MSLTDTLKNTLSALTEGGLNRYRLDIPSCTASLDVEEFNGKEFMSELTTTTSSLPAAIRISVQRNC